MKMKSKSKTDKKHTQGIQDQLENMIPWLASIKLKCIHLRKGHFHQLSVSLNEIYLKTKSLKAKLIS